MLYLITEFPRYCPACGFDHGTPTERDSFGDFFAGASQQCQCAAMCAYASPTLIVEAAQKQGSDLDRYADRQPGRTFKRKSR